MPKPRKTRIPKLSYTANRGIGFYVAFRDPITNSPRRHRFGMVSREEALRLYDDWLAGHLRGETAPSRKRSPRKLVEQIDSEKPAPIKVDIVPGSLLHITSGLLQYDESRVRRDDVRRTKGTIKRKQYESIRDLSQDFLKFLNTRHGSGAVARMQLTDLTLEDVEAYNRLLVQSDYSDSQVKKRLLVVKSIIDRAGRPEHGKQVLQWNWDSRDVLHGRPDKPITLPTVTQLKLILQKCDVQRTAIVWMAIGCGFGQSDLAAVEVGQFDRNNYDLRRGKTGIDRYGQTPKLVWNCLQEYLAQVPRPVGALMFITETGMPLVHPKADSIAKWWTDLRASLSEAGEGLNGFYSLRHLGATEYGSRPGCSIGDMRRWLGHAISSRVADRYMKPVSPEYREVVEWVRKCLESGKVDLRLTAKRKRKT